MIFNKKNNRSPYDAKSPIIKPCYVNVDVIWKKSNAAPATGTLSNDVQERLMQYFSNEKIRA